MKKHPDLIDAKALRLLPEALADMTPELLSQSLNASEGGRKNDPNEPLFYKYVISTHGPGSQWSNRFRSLLTSGAVVFKQESALKEFWEEDLVPFKHYIPVQEDMSDLIEMLEWAKDNDQESKAIAKAALRFVQENLSAERVTCYWARLLTGFGSVMGYAPERTLNTTHYVRVPYSSLVQLG